MKFEATYELNAAAWMKIRLTLANWFHSVVALFVDTVKTKYSS